MKKLISIILVVLTIFSLTVSMSFAANEDELTIESVEFIDNYPISKMDLDPYDYALEDLSDSNTFTFNSSALPYELKVVFTDGTEVEYNLANDFICKVNENYSIVVIPFVTAVDLVDATENNKSEIPVNIVCVGADSSDGSILSELLENIENEKAFHCKTKKPFCKQYVKSIKPVSDLSDTVYEGAEYYEMAGKRFRVEYYDGTKKTYTVVENGVSADYSVPQFTLGGIEIESSVFFGETEIFYIDNSYSFDVKEKAYPFKEINVKDYTFDEELGLTSITYEIVAKKTYERTVDLTPYIEASGDVIPIFETIDAFRGFYVYIYDDTPEDDDSVFNVVLSIGETETTLEIENPNPTPKGLFARIIAFFVNLIRNIFAKIFG